MHNILQIFKNNKLSIQEIWANVHETHKSLEQFLFANCQFISSHFVATFTGVLLFDALMRRFPSTYKIKTWTVEIYVQCWKFRVELVQVYLNWFRRNSLLKCVSQPEIAKKSIKPLFLCSRSFKVIEFGGNRETVYDFLLVINSNLGPILHRYWDTATCWLQITNFSHPLLI